MSPQYLSPGVYVEEVERGSRPIEGVGTAIAAFAGFTEKGPVNKPTFIANWTQFATTFGGFIPGGFLASAVYGYFNNGGGGCYIVRLPSGEAGESAPAQASIPAKGDRAISSLVINSIEAGVSPSEFTVEVNEPSEGAPEDQFTLKIRHGAKEESFENVTMKKTKGARNVVETVNRESKLVKIAEKESTLSLAERTPAAGSYALAPAASHAVTAISADQIIGNAAARSGIAGLESADDVTMVCVPDLMALYQAGKMNADGVKAVQQAVLDHCANMRDRFAILDCPPAMNPQDIKEWRMKEAGYDSKYGAVYYPWIKVANPHGGDPVLVPPCGHMAGIYARSDTERGVHKAPANEIVRGALGVETKITKSEQDILNPSGINCIRPFPGRGIRVWGARTLSSDAQWRYINVRRLFNFVEESIEIGTQWVVFEPNDRDLWERIKRDIKAFLTRVWRDGALFGATPDEAFYVKCDDELNTVEIRDAGQVIIEIGIAPVKPAEFVIFRISQWSGGAAIGE
jgi:uncharacterized protein